MKKMLALALAILMTLSLMAGCNAAGEDDLKATYTVTGKYKNHNLTTVTPGKLTVAVSPDFAPMEFVDPTKAGQDMYVGFDLTLAKYIADELGLELMIMPMSFEACQTAVYTGMVDISISGYSWSEKREANYNLSGYYYAGDNENEQVLITLKANGDKFATAESLKGAKVGAQNASLQQALVEAQLPDSELILNTDLGTLVLQLKSGEIDALAVADGNGDALQCVDALGKLYDPDFITEHFRQLLKKHNLKKIRFHDLRHSCASVLLAQGVPMKQIQEWLGHSDMSTTANIYSHLDAVTKADTGAAMSKALG